MRTLMRVISEHDAPLGGFSMSSSMMDSLPDDRMHAPNEKMHLPNFFRGIAASICFLAEIGAKASPHFSTSRIMRRQNAAGEGVPGGLR
jgi:hypothetical protein